MVTEGRMATLLEWPFRPKSGYWWLLCRSSLYDDSARDALRELFGIVMECKRLEGEALWTGMASGEVQCDCDWVAGITESLNFNVCSRASHIYWATFCPGFF